MAPAPAAAASAEAPLPPGSAPPLYYVEPRGAAPGTAGEPVYEPPPPVLVYEPPPPPSLSRRAPRKTALWAGVRVGALIPFGSLWIDGFDPYYGYYRRRSFADYASPGPSFELNIGARLARRYNVFALWEHASLGTGSLDDSSFGKQQRGATNLYGAGLRFSTDPTSVGFLMEIALGYRDFRAYWDDGTKLTLSGGWLDARIGLGADIRINRWLSLSPMIVLGGGSFSRARWSGPSIVGDALDPLDESGEYGTLSFQLGAHADVL